MAALGESDRLAAFACLLVHCCALDSEVEEAMDLDEYRNGLLGHIPFADAFFVRDVNDSIRCWASMQQPIPYPG